MSRVSCFLTYSATTKACFRAQNELLIVYKPLLTVFYLHLCIKTRYDV